MIWTTACQDLVDLMYACPVKQRAIFECRLRGYIMDLHPDVLIEAYLKANKVEEQQFYWLALLALEETERIQVVEACIRDLSPIFLHELDDIEAFLEHVKRTQYEEIDHKTQRLEKLNRYLKRVDGAINNRKYRLALGLANRCLHEYYRDFLRYTMKYELKSIDNMNLMAIHIYRYIIGYFRTNNIPYSATRLLFITIVTNALLIALSSSETLVDRAVATYARNNVNSIVRLLMRYA